MMLLLIFAITFSVVANAASISFKGNVSANVEDYGWQYRTTSLQLWNDGLWLGANYQSAYVELKKGKNAKVDVVFGAISFDTDLPPRAFVASFSGPAQSQGKNWANLNVNAARGFIGNAYLRLVESNVQGEPVVNQTLAPSLLNGFSWAITDQSTDDQNSLKWVTFTGQQTGASWVISITFVVSNVAGVLDVANTTVTPVSIESIVNITGWPYQDQRNSLSIYMLVATGPSQVEQNALISGSTSNASAVSFSLSNTALINNSTKSVQISAWADASEDEITDSDFLLQLKGKYSTKKSIKIVHVTFPANASSIVYDPSVGATSISMSSSSCRVIMSVGAAFLVILMIIV